MNMESETRSTLPPASAIRDFYDRQLRELGGDYFRFRWADSEIKRRHFGQTFSALTALLGRYPVRGDVLEIGPGPAVWTQLYIDNAEKVTLLDISEEMLKSAKVRIDSWDAGRYAAAVSYICNNALEVSFPVSRFDSIITMRAFEYFADKRQFMSKCAQWLRPGGRLIIGTKNSEWKDAQEQRAARERAAGVAESDVAAEMQADLVSPSQLALMAQEAGFEVREVRPLVFGSYLRRYQLPGALWYFDRLHRKYGTSPLRRASSFAESFVIVADRPAL
jgi:ubiquinone/menaquinone biosynthesis C-methylase UbiE